MARIKKKEMSKHFTILFLFFQTLCQICHSLETVESHNQAFIQTDKHLTYIVGDVSSGIPIEVKAGQVYNEIVGREDILLPNAIQLDPAMLDFQEQPVGMPRMESVTVHNTDRKNNLHLLSISGSTAHFHCSFFQDKIVPPGGNTTFDVVFLARQEGNVENTLYIHTSLGSFKYQVFGVGTANPYRLRPYLGARLPINSSFAPLINMHNPHSTTLQVLEVFSSEGDLHLELPTGEKEAPRSLWEIPPYETKTIMKANFVGRTESNHTAFIRIKTNHKPEKQLLILPMEVEVTSSPGVYVATELVDFGIVRTFDEPKTVPINLINTGEQVVHISSVTVHPPNEAISVDFRPIKLQPEFPRQTTVAHITFRASKAIHPKFWSGKIIIKSKNNVHKIAIPYEAKVLHGSLTYHKNSTYFFAHNHPTNYSRLMMFTNTFNFSLVLFNVTLPPELKEIFSILNFTKPVILPPQKLITPFILKFHPKVAMMHFKTVLSLHTNASIFHVELIIYNGQLKIVPHRPEKLEGQLDFGTMGVKENKSVLFTLVNDNPIELYIYEYSTDMKGATLEVLGIERGNGTTLTRYHNMSAVNTNPLVIWPYHYAVFSLNLVAPEEEGLYQAEVIIATPFQDTFMPVTVRTSEGSLHAIPERLVFDKVFPGKIPMKVLQVHSTFHDQMGLKSVSFQPTDHRFYFISHRSDSERRSQDRLLILEPQTNNTIGKIFYDSKKTCKDECYVGLSTHTPAGHRWVQGLELDKETAETDAYLYKHLRDRWRTLQEEGKDKVNVTIEIDTSTVQGFLFSAHVQHHWPDVIRKCRSRFKFPLTQIGNMSTLDVIIENTGDIPVIVQILPLHLYPTPQTIVDLFKQYLPSHFSEFVETDDPDIFSLSELMQLNAKADSAVNRFRKFVDETLGVHSHRDTISSVMEKGAKVKVQIGFTPKDDLLKTSLIIVRNNLTIVDAVVIEGQGGRGELKLNNKRPGVSFLQFDIAEKHLKNCDKKKNAKNNVPNFTVKKQFTLRNTGELPFYVHGYSINQAACEGYGFRVLDCEGYEMKPNTSRKIDIAFTPDFTMSRIQRTLTIYTSLGQAFNYTLQATVPPHTLSKCSASLPRPNWEPVLYYSIVCVMGFIMFCILVASYFEADRIFVADILKRKVKLCNGGTSPFQKEQIFDLKSLGVSHNGAVPMASSSPTVKTSPPLPAHLINKIPRPMLEMSNGHIEHKTQENFWSSLASTFKSLFMRKAAANKKKLDNNNVINSTPVPRSQADNTITLTASPASNIHAEKDKPVAVDTVIPEKSSSVYNQHPHQQKLTLRKTKPPKRTHTEYSTPSVEQQHTTSTSSHVTSTSDRKQSTKSSNNSSSNETRRLADTTSSIKDVISTLPTVTHQDSTSGLATFDDIKIYDNSKQKGKKKLRSKPDRDSLIKERLLQRQLDDKDETSSTTTESSTGDIDDKLCGTRNGSPEPIVPPPKPKKKTKTRNLEPLIMPQPDDDAEDFELTSKSRAYKKIKGQYGGEISVKTDSRDISLPYNIEKTKAKKKKAISPVAKEPEKINKKKGYACDLDLLDDFTMDTHHLSESDSPVPSWDEPHLASPSDDFTELSIQTDQFAQRHIKTGDVGGVSQLTSISPDGLTNSSRSSSYSSIVSSSSNGDAINNKIKVDKRYPVGFTPFDVSPGPLAAKTPPPLNTNNKRNAWGNGANTSPTPADVPGFSLQTIQEDSRPGNTMTDTQAGGAFNQPAFSFGLTAPSSSDSNYGFMSSANTGVFGTSPDSSTMTMMQSLQLDRRRRVIEHQNRVLKAGDGWPGFDVPLTRNESLWDSEYNPLDPNNTWANVPDSQPSSSPNGLWSTLTNSANSSWNSLMGIWTGSSTSAQTHGLNSDSIYTTADGGNVGNMGGVGNVGQVGGVGNVGQVGGVGNVGQVGGVGNVGQVGGVGNVGQVGGVNQMGGGNGAPPSPGMNTPTPTDPENIPTFNPFSSRIWSPSAVGSSTWTMPTNQPPNSAADDQSNNN